MSKEIDQAQKAKLEVFLEKHKIWLMMWNKHNPREKPPVHYDTQIGEWKWLNRKQRRRKQRRRKQKLALSNRIQAVSNSSRQGGLNHSVKTNSSESLMLKRLKHLREAADE